MNAAIPLNAPLPGFAAPLVTVPATGVPGSTLTVMICSTTSTPLVALTVKVSVVVAVAALRCAAVGVYRKAPVEALTLSFPPPVEVVGLL